MFTDCHSRTIPHHGFQMKFANGWTVSVQFGFGNYCDNRDGKSMSSKNAEMAAWDKDGNWYHFEHDDVKGWVTPEAAAEFIHKVSQF